MADGLPDGFAEGITKEILERIERAEVSALKSMEAFYKRRIFNARLATDGSSLGDYKSPKHIAKRKKANRQVVSKDLELTGKVRNDIQVGKFRNKNVLAFVDTMSRLIMEGQERKNQVGKDVVSPSDEVNMVGLETYIEEIFDNLSI